MSCRQEGQRGAQSACAGRERISLGSVSSSCQVWRVPARKRQPHEQEQDVVGGQLDRGVARAAELELAAAQQLDRLGRKRRLPSTSTSTPARPATDSAPS